MLIRQHDRLARDTELATLRSLREGLESAVRTTHEIPAPGTMAATIASRSGRLLSAVTTTSRGYPRYFIADPALRLGNPATNLPYVQSASGSLLPVNARVLIVSSLGSVPSTNITVGAATSAARFDELWSGVEGQPPTGWATADRWDEIMIQRINLAPLFLPLILNNNSADVGRYSIDNTNQRAALPASPFSSYYLAGSVIGLHRHDGSLQARMVLQDIPQITNATSLFPAQSFVYERDVWRGKLFLTEGGQRHSGLDLESAFQVFVGGSANTYNVAGVTQASLTQKMAAFMTNYVAWANTGFDEDERDPVEDAQEALADELTTYCNKKATAAP